MLYTQTNILDAIAEGERLKDQGIQLAADHADAVTEEWSFKAYKAGLQFIIEHGLETSFMVEDLRMWCYRRKIIPRPPSDRAWGKVILNLRKAGLIVSNGFTQVTNPKAHRTPATLWKIISKP